MSVPAIFISHTSKDAAWCVDFVANLRQGGADVWIDQDGLGLEKVWDDIEQQIISRPIFVGILSPAALNASGVREEIEGALSLMREQEDRLAAEPDDPSPRRSLLFVVASPCSLPLFWRRY